MTTSDTDDSISNMLSVSWLPGRPHSHYYKVSQDLYSVVLYKGSIQQQVATAN